MLNRILLLVFIFFSLNTGIFAAEVIVHSDVYISETVFTYIFEFNEDESYQSFSFEKPKNSIVEYARDKSNNNTLFYTVAGDFFIFKPEDTSNKKFEIQFKSQEISNQIFEKDSYSSYVNFNIPIAHLTYILTFVDEIGEIGDIFPRDYEIDELGRFVWTIPNVEKDTIFLVNFNKFIEKEIIVIPEIITSIDDTKIENITPLYKDKYFILISIISIVILILLTIFGRTLLKIISIKSKEEKIIIKENSSIIETLNSISKEESPKEESQKETYGEFIEKYLTDNEKDVVNIIKENEGLSQYDILNHLPSLSKSNLSKIISKLHAKKILNRIKVGKINKIYFGEKLDQFSNKKE